MLSKSVGDALEDYLDSDDEQVTVDEDEDEVSAA